MTKRLFLLSVFLCLAHCVLAAPTRLEGLSVGTTTYSNVVIIGANATDLYFTHSQGVANVKLKYLSKELQTRFNYDPKAAAEAEKRQAAEESAYQRNLASNAVAQAQKAAQKEPLPPATSDVSLADPLSEKSLLGKPMPEIQVSNWLSEKPDCSGKCTLLVFWAPWSIPSKKALPELSAFHKKFPDKLVLLGICPEPASAVTDLAEPKVDFAVGIDEGGKLAGAAGVTSVPSVVLMDSKRTVLYQGHPAALTEKKLQALISKTVD